MKDVQASSASSAARTVDDALVDACREGDRAALEVVFRRHAARLAAFLHRLTGRSADVEDLLQNTFIAAMGAFPRYRGEASVERWLSCIAARVARDHFRRADNRRRVPLEVLSLEGELPAPDPTAERRAWDRRRLERFYVHLDRIKPDQRLAFMLHVVEGLSIEEIAQLVGTTMMATKSRIFWARRALLARAEKDPILREWLGEIEGEGGHS